MRRSRPPSILHATPALLAAALAATTLPLAAQVPARADHDRMMQHPPSVTADLVQDLSTARQKMVSLAEAIPEETYSWRPGEGVRSVPEVLLHVAADNYVIPGGLGVAVPAEVGIQPDDYATVQAFQGQEVSKAEAIQKLQASFDHLVAAIQGATPEDLGREVAMYGQQFTGQSLLLMVTTHVHEHLGQLIAYARTNGVVPPWSR